MKSLNILYQFDDNYAPYAGVSMLSLFHNNKDIENLVVYCITMDVGQKNIDKLNKTAEKYGREIIYVDSSKTLENMKKIDIKGWNGSLATWMKMFVIGEFVGKIDSLLYIDSDTLVEGSLSELCEYNFEGNAVACVADSVGFRHYRRLGLKKNRYYFNAGVIFFNLKYFEEKTDAYKEMIVHLDENVERYYVNDQDLLNDYFDGNIKPLSPKYNFQGIHCMYSDSVYYKVYAKNETYYDMSEIAQARKNPGIIHFFRALGDYPWEPGNFHPVRKEFEKWKSRSLWKDYQVPKKIRKLFFKIERALYIVLPKAAFLRLFKYMKSRDGYK